MRGSRAGIALAVAAVWCAGSAATAQEPSRAEILRTLREASVLARSAKPPDQASLTANIAGQQTRAGDLLGALQTARSLRDPRDQALALGSIAWSLDRAGNLAGALEILRQIRDRAGAAYDYENLALARAWRKDFPTAVWVARLIGDPSLRANVLERIAKGQAKAGDVEGTALTIEGARAIVQGTRDDSRALPDMIADLVAAETAVGDPSEAQEESGRLATLLQEKTNPTSRWQLLQQLAVAQAGSGEILLALQTIDKLPPGWARATALSFTAVSQARQGDWVDGVATAREIPPEYSSLGTLREIALILARRADPSAAWQAAGDISDQARRAEALASVALEEAIRKMPSAIETLELAEAAAQQLNEKNAAPALRVIATTWAEMGDLVRAREITAELPDSQSKKWPLENLAMAMAERGDWSGAVALGGDQTEPSLKADLLWCAAAGALDRIEDEARQQK